MMVPVYSGFFADLFDVSALKIISLHFPEACLVLTNHWSVCLPLYVLIIAAILVSVIVFAIYFHFKNTFTREKKLLEQTINKKTEEIISKNVKTDALLANVLPRNTADEIMTKGKAEKVKYNFVTVLFSDIQGFTQIAEEMNPELLIDELDKFFLQFDTVVEKYGIEKIKTVGDAYMCAGGLPEKNRTNPVEVILAALEMQEYMKKIKEMSEIQGMKHWDIRIGIHTGTVVAGVVGHKKLSYDIWGDTVNTASRMESSGEAGKVNISGTTYEFVKDFFICEHRGKMPVKYKGELDMYFVKEIVQELRDDKGQPNESFVYRMHLIRLEDVEDAVFKFFAEEAPPNLYFHNSAMARSIVNQVDLLAKPERLSEEQYFEVRLASLFLITGYVTDYENPYEAACALMDEILPRFNFKAGNTDKSKSLICNSFAERYDTLSDMILHDAQYDYLGRSDYVRLTDRLYRERTEHGMAISRDEWVTYQKKYLAGHDFLTETGRILRSVKVEDQTDNLLNYYS